AGCVVIGKTAVPELSVWPFTESRVSGATRNPWDPARTPGGSSGGSAVARAERGCGRSEPGPLTTTVADAALMLDVLAGTDRHRHAALPERPLRVAVATRAPVRGVRVAAGPVAGVHPTARGVAPRGAQGPRAAAPLPP